jgi:hypothetical protein
LRRYEAIDAVFDWFRNGQFEREVSCFAAEGMGVIALSTENRRGHVEFDFFRIWEAMKAAPVMPRLAWMYHTHPPDAHGMSPTDENAVKGWVTALGMPVEMVVISDAGPRHYRCRKGNVVEDRFYPDDDPPDTTEEFISAVLCGLSMSANPCPEADLDEMSAVLSEVIPVRFWDFFEHE